MWEGGAEGINMSTQKQGRKDPEDRMNEYVRKISSLHWRKLLMTNCDLFVEVVFKLRHLCNHEGATTIILLLSADKHLLDAIEI